MTAEQAAEALQQAAGATHEAIAAVAAAKVALDAARKGDQYLVMEVAQTFRNCESIMNERIQEEIQAQIELFNAQVAEFDPTPPGAI